MDPFWPLLMYTMDIVLGSFYIISGTQRHQRLGVLVGAIVLLLSLVWLITTIRSRIRLSRRDVWIRGQIVIWILLAYEAAYTISARLL
jgi:hypothetical protein